MPEKTNKLPQGFVQQTGYIAFNSGLSVKDCPYDMWMQYMEFHEWCEGWLKAKKESGK